MDNEQDCPECGAPIPSTGMWSKVGLGDGRAERQQTQCPSCRVNLVRDMNPPANEWVKHED